MDYSSVIDRIYNEVLPYRGRGKVADYIPALAEVDPDRFGIALETIDGEIITRGDSGIPFSIQSISKVFTFAMAVGHLGEKIWESVGREPSGNPFNSLVQLEYEKYPATPSSTPARLSSPTGFWTFILIPRTPFSASCESCVETTGLITTGTWLCQSSYIQTATRHWHIS